jgi:hypothetical protein
MAVELDPSGMGGKRSDAALEQRRLAGSVVAEHGDAPPCLEGERNTLQRVEGAIVRVDVNAGQQACHAR